MYRPQNRWSKSLLLSTFIACALIACERDKDTNTNTPAHHISASEKLSIPAAIELPDNLPGGNARVVTYYAEGVQKYKAQAKAGSPGVFEWVFVAPQADLFNASNVKIGTHSAGPTWQLSATDSLYGQAFTPAKSAPSPDAGNIDWLLLKPKDGKTPTGIFANVSYIQRIDTKGGKAPATAPTNANETANVPYTAIYRFSKKN